VNLTFKIWRQKNAQDKGKLVAYQLDDISPDMSFLEMLDVLNQKLILEGDLSNGSWRTRDCVAFTGDADLRVPASGGLGNGFGLFLAGPRGLLGPPARAFRR
jgi:hypothetical protein